MAELLKLHLVLRHQVLLFLSQVTKVFGRSTSEDLTRWHSRAFGNDCACGDDGERFDSGSTADRGSHADEGIVVERARVKLRVGSDITVLADGNGVAIPTCIAADAHQVLDGCVLTNDNACGVTAHDD